MRNGLHALPERKFYSWVVSCSYSEAHGIRTPLYLILRWTAARAPQRRTGVARSCVEAHRLRSTLSLAGEGACAPHCLFFQFWRFWQFQTASIGLRSIKQVFPPLGV